MVISFSIWNFFFVSHLAICFVSNMEICFHIWNFFFFSIWTFFCVVETLSLKTIIDSPLCQPEGDTTSGFWFTMNHLHWICALPLLRWKRVKTFHFNMCLYSRLNSSIILK
jgi:hypothetical protein